jgi:hypothetical protein
MRELLNQSNYSKLGLVCIIIDGDTPYEKDMDERYEKIKTIAKNSPLNEKSRPYLEKLATDAKGSGSWSSYKCYTPNELLITF